jgi:hypothetical protein
MRRLRICERGHHFYKSSDCPVCPVCEEEEKPEDGFLAELSAPARRALLNNGITGIKELASLTEKQVLDFHGLGPASLPKLRKALRKAGLRFS